MVALLLLALAVVGGFWLADRGNAADDEKEPLTPESTAGHPSPPGIPRAHPAIAAPPLDPQAARTEAAADREPGIGLRPGTPDPRRFEGPAGTIRGHVEVMADVAFPSTWKLILGPSTTLTGRERAVSREIEFTDGCQDFEVKDLPLAGYDVRAVAEGMNGYPVSVLLERRSPEQFINMALSPAGVLEGTVVDENAAPAEDLPLILEALSDGRTRTTITDARGNFRFDGVLDGSYKLHYGHQYSPVREPRSLQFTAPFMTLPPDTIPVLAGLWIQVLDVQGNAVEGATVRGTGTGGGYVEGVTDYRGLLLVRHIPAGRLRLRAEHPDFGSRRKAVDLVAGELAEVTVSFP